MFNGSAFNAVAFNGGNIELEIRELCALARSRVERMVATDVSQDVRLTEIDRDVLAHAKPWRRAYLSAGRPLHEPGWDWGDEYYRRGRKRSGVTLAIWHGEVLCGLMIGQVSDGRLHATIHFLEGNPSGNPLRGEIVSIATVYIETVGALVGCEVVRIASPIPDLVPHYKDFGYTVEHKKNGIIKFLDKVMAIEGVDALQENSQV